MHDDHSKLAFEHRGYKVVALPKDCWLITDPDGLKYKVSNMTKTELKKEIDMKAPAKKAKAVEAKPAKKAAPKAKK